MKAFQKVFLALVIAFIASSCQTDETSCVRVDGPIETQKRTISDFNSIFFSNVGNLHISQENEYSFIIKGQRAILDRLNVSVIKEELVIEVENCFNGDAYSLDIFISAPEIRKIKMHGVGSVNTESPISTEVFSFQISGVSELNVLEINADSISTYHLGTGNILYTGAARTHTILTSGVGDIDAYAMPSVVTTITSNSIGDIFVTVSENLKAVINNIGNVYYKGYPVITKEENNLGKVIDAN